MAKFEIYALPVGGGQLALAPEPTRDDHSQLATWSPDLVVSMIETGTPIIELGPDTWVHFPVKDYDVPASATMAAWSELSEKIQIILAQGGRVLFHCRGGCGRSGMAVLRIMIAVGEAPDTALTRLRALRPCAVETAAQLQWAQRGQHP